MMLCFGIAIDWHRMTVTLRKRQMNRILVIFAICFFLCAVVIMKTAIQRYHEVRKYFRLQEYASEVHEISESLKTLEENALSLEDDVIQLKKIAQDAFQQFNSSVSNALS